MRGVSVSITEAAAVALISAFIIGVLVRLVIEEQP